MTWAFLIIGKMKQCGKAIKLKTMEKKGKYTSWLNFGSLLPPEYKSNYSCLITDQPRLIHWINTHLLLNWVKFVGDFENMESALIKAQLPLLNTAKNPAKLPELAALRKDCRNWANKIS